MDLRMIFFGFRRLRIGRRSILVLCGLSLLLFSTQRAIAQISLQDVVANVRASEMLYADIEQVYDKEYRFNQNLPDKLLDDPDGELIQRRDVTRREIRQGERLFLHETYNAKTRSGKPIRDDEKQAYDGEIHRIVTSAFANIHHERPTEEPVIIAPHSFLVADGGYPLPLSKFLDATSSLSGSSTYVWSVDGEEEIDGLHCVRVRLDTYLKPSEDDSDASSSDQLGRERLRVLLWLATDRNYIPTRYVCYRRDLNTATPIEVGTARDFREVGPGIWMPFRVERHANLARALADGEVLESFSETWTVEKAKLDPNYDISQFQNIEIPPGLPVYVIKKGEIVESYTKPNDGPVALSKPNHRWRLILLAVNVVVVAGLLIWWLVRRSGWGQHSSDS